MATNSRIEWTDTTWNPVTGCSRVSHGCKHCYAETMAKRLKAMGAPRYDNGFKVTLHHDLIDTPRKWRKPRRVFVCSMADLFHREVPDKFIQSVFGVMRDTPHTYQVLTKRIDRAADMFMCEGLKFADNIWIGTSIESVRYTDRADHLRAITGAKVRFLSCEPLLGRLDSLNLAGIDWVIAGGESGSGARPMAVGWARHIRDLCAREGVPFFFKQWGGVNKKAAGRVLDGRTHDEMPDDNWALAV